MAQISLEEKLKLDINDGERASALETLTSNMQLSFIKKEEIAL